MKKLCYLGLGLSLISSCTKSTLNGTGLNLNGYAQILMTLNGKTLDKTYGIDVSNAYQTGINTLNDSLYYFSFGARFDFDSTHSLTITLGIVPSTNDIYVGDTLFDTFLAPGPKSYAPLSENPVVQVNGAEVLYTANSSQWSSTTDSTAGGGSYSISQGSNAFSIDASKAVNNYFGHHTVKVLGHFGCTLYNTLNPSDTFQIQSAEFVAYFTNN